MADRKLSDREYFTLETHEHEIQMENREIQISKKNVKIAELNVELCLLKNKLSSVNIAAEGRNVAGRLTRVAVLQKDLRGAREGVAKRLKIKEKNWDYCKQTSLIKLPKGA